MGIFSKKVELTAMPPALAEGTTSYYVTKNRYKELSSAEKKRLSNAKSQADATAKAAEAYAYKTKTLADADFYKATNDAQSIVARAEAEAQGMQQLADSLRLVATHGHNGIRTAEGRGVCCGKRH